MILAEPREDPRQELGRVGEHAAASLLSGKGYRLLERRYRRRTGEVDLILERGELLVFVEVKARRGHGYGEPAEAVTPTKRRRIARSALAYLTLRGWGERPCRFDVVEVLASGSEVVSMRHIEDAFRVWPTG